MIAHPSLYTHKEFFLGSLSTQTICLTNIPPAYPLSYLLSNYNRCRFELASQRQRGVLYDTRHEMSIFFFKKNLQFCEKNFNRLITRDNNLFFCCRQPSFCL